MPVKLGLCIGINYTNTDKELRGCVNDAEDWGNLLTKNNFTITNLIESSATKENIIDNITKLISSLHTDDVGAITVSSHGCWIPSHVDDEPDARDEAICPVDVGMDGKNLITGPEFKKLFDNINPGAKVIFITDCCFSGSVYRFFCSDFIERKVRFIPPAHFLMDLTLINRMNLGFGQHRSNIKINPVKTPLPNLIHYSSCGDNEYASDANIENRFNGAFTYFAIKAFTEVLESKGTYGEVWKLIRKFLPNWSFQQSPRINAFPELKSLPLFT